MKLVVASSSLVSHPMSNEQLFGLFLRNKYLQFKKESERREQAERWIKSGKLEDLQKMALSSSGQGRLLLKQ